MNHDCLIWASTPNLTLTIIGPTNKFGQQDTEGYWPVSVLYIDTLCTHEKGGSGGHKILYFPNSIGIYALRHLHVTKSFRNKFGNCCWYSSIYWTRCGSVIRHIHPPKSPLPHQKCIKLVTCHSWLISRSLQYIASCKFIVVGGGCWRCLLAEGINPPFVSSQVNYCV